MKEKKFSPYGDFGLEVIKSPKGKPKGTPRATKNEGKGDLRCPKK